jgi:hypothetical protein
MVFQRGRGTVASPGDVQSSDTLGMILFYGVPSSGYSARIVARATGAFSSGSAPTQLYFATTASGASSVNRYTVMDEDGSWMIQDDGAVNDADESALLEVKSTTRGFLPPRMTKAQRDAIASPANGLIIYQTDNTAGIRFYEGGAWVRPTVTADP